MTAGCTSSCCRRSRKHGTSPEASLPPCSHLQVHRNPPSPQASPTLCQACQESQLEAAYALQTGSRTAASAQPVPDEQVRRV